jgi:2-polyprenyl-3-methyl-5-hydroxy-6-metoxy-1,4-benzoquinol methylase
MDLVTLPKPQVPAPPEATYTRENAYTTPRADVFEMVPGTAVSILDVGCSSGALGASLKAARPGRKVTGLEYDADFVKVAEERLDRVIQVDLNNFDWKTGFPDAQFDCIIFADVLEHLVKFRDHLVQAQRCLLPNGVIVISLPNIRHVSALFSIYANGTFPRRDRGIFDRTHLHWFTIQDAKDLLNEVGLKVEALSYSFRLWDRGDTTPNRIARKCFEPIVAFFPVREFFSYQFCVRAVKI